MQKLRYKLMISNERLQKVIQTMRHLEVVEDYEKITVALRDKDDEIILATAIHAECNVLLTGDMDLLSVKDEIEEVEILSPREFWEKYHEY